MILPPNTIIGQVETVKNVFLPIKWRSFLHISSIQKYNPIFKNPLNSVAVAAVRAFSETVVGARSHFLKKQINILLIGYVFPSRAMGR